MLGKKTKETIIIAIYEKLGRGNSRWPLTHQTNKSLTFSPGKQRVHRTVCRGGVELERESVTGSAVLHGTEASRTGSQLQCDNSTSRRHELLRHNSCFICAVDCCGIWTEWAVDLWVNIVVCIHAFMIPCWFIDSFLCYVKRDRFKARSWPLQLILSVL